MTTRHFFAIVAGGAFSASLVVLVLGIGGELAVPAAAILTGIGVMYLIGLVVVSTR